MNLNSLLGLYFVAAFITITVIASVVMITKANKKEIQVVEKGSTEIYLLNDTIYCGDTKFIIK